MMYLIEQTREEKVKMYMKLSKKELIEMLFTNQGIVEGIYSKPKAIKYTPPFETTWTIGNNCSQ